MQEHLMAKGEWVKPPMTRTEWQLALNMGYRREYKNKMEGAVDHAVDKKMKSIYESMKRCIFSCFAELSACKVYNVYPDLQNRIKLPYDLEIEHTRWDKYTGENYTRKLKIDVKTPANDKNEWVVVAEKYERKMVDIYLWISSHCPYPIYGKGNGPKSERFYRPDGSSFELPILDIEMNTDRFVDHKHGCKCMGFMPGEKMFNPANKRRPEWSESGFFVTQDELYRTLEDCLD